MSYLHIWNDIFWKDAIFWFFTSFIMLFSANHASNDKDHYKKEFIKLFKVESLVIFITSLHSFSLVIEIMLIPIVSLIVILETFCSTDKEYNQVNKVFKTIITFIGLFIIYLSIIDIISNPERYYKVTNLYSFTLPILLTILYIPFLYTFSLYMVYENLFVSLKIFLKNTVKFSDKIRILFICGTSISNVKKIQNRISIDNVRSRKELLVSIKNYASQ
ncbi:MAG: hypothetical protein PHE29_07825 [Tissierellia bacterium]|nr:hypothetical protein [Tissierellia bacterium]